MIKANEIDYQEEIEKLLKIPKIKEYSQLQYLQFLKQEDTKSYYENLLTKFKELERQRELQATPEIAKQADHQQINDNEDNLLFIHNSKQWRLLKENIKQGVFIDKLLIVISHEFLVYERQEIDISLEKLCNYLSLNYKKATLNYIRKQIKNITDILIDKDFITNMTIKNSVLICKLSTLFISEMKEKRIITKLPKIAFSLSSDEYKAKRITSFFESNLKIKQNELNIESLISYFKDTNKNRKKNEIKKILDMQ